MLVFFEGCYLPAGRGLVGLMGLVFECSFPADVGVITNHQRQGKWCFFRVERLGFRCADLGFRIENLEFRIENLEFLIKDNELLITNHKLPITNYNAKRAERSGLP